MNRRTSPLKQVLLYVALALLWASATAALSLAQLLSLAARRDATA